MQITQISVESLIPYAMNSRTHSDAQVTQIAASIKEFGFLNPIIVDGKNGIIAGHGRLLAAKKLGMEQVPTVEASHLTDVQRKAYIIADNQIATNSSWDEEKLQISLEELLDSDFDMSLLGWGDNLPQFIDEPDYSVLGNSDIDSQLDSLASNVKKAIQIEFEQDHYEDAREIVSYWRNRDAYVGKMILDFLTSEKNKNET